MKRIPVSLWIMIFFSTMPVFADSSMVLTPQKTEGQSISSQKPLLPPPSSLTIKGKPVRKVEKIVFETSVEKKPSPKLQERPHGGLAIDQQKIEKLILDGNDLQTVSYMKELEGKADSHEQKAVVVATYANVLGRVSRIKKDDPKLQLKAAELYKKSLPSLKGDMKLLTANNYGTLLLRQKNPEEALSVLTSVETEYSRSTDQKKQSTYYYNLGRAYENSGDLLRATATYQKAAVADPAFSPASRAVNRLLPKVKSSAETPGQTAQWLTAMVEKGDLALSRKSFISIFSKQDLYTRKGFEKILIAFIRYLTEEKVGPNRFSGEWMRRLPPSGRTTKETSDVVKEINKAYTQHYEIHFQPHSGSRYFPAVLGAAKQVKQTGSVTRFVKMIGDQYKNLGMPKQALQRFSMAWTMDTSNMEAAYSIAYTLLDNNGNLAEADELLDRFTFELFELKGAAYRAPIGEDWENILRFHLVLGAIYSQKGILGSSREVRSAIFQLEHAVSSHSRLMDQKKTKKAGPIAGVQVELGNVYKKTGNIRRAGSAYVRAAESAVRENDMLFARQIVWDIRENLNQYRLSSRDKARLDLVEATLSRPAPVENLRIE